MKKKVSILIPVYNREDLIEDSIRSAQNQTYKNREIIVVDNASTDRTAQIVKSLAAKDSTIHFHENKKNLGPVGNWKQCLKHATGEYVKFLWSDDLIEPDFMDKCISSLEENPDAGFVFTKVKIFNERGFKPAYNLKRTGKYSREIFIRGLMTNRYDIPVSPGCGLFRKDDIEIIETIPNDFNIDHMKTGAGIDLFIFLNVFKKYDSFIYINEYLSLFRNHENALTISNDLSRAYYTAKLHYLENNPNPVFRKSLLGEIAIRELLQKRKIISKEDRRKFLHGEPGKFAILRGVRNMTRFLLHRIRFLKKNK